MQREVPRVARCARRARLPLNRSLLRCIDVLAGAAPEEKRGQVVRQKRACLRIHHVEAVVIDQHGLLFEPIAPALLADLLNYTGADLPWKRSTVEAGAGLAAAGAFHIRHGNSKSIRARLCVRRAVQTAIEFNGNVKCRATRTQWYREPGTVSLRVATSRCRLSLCAARSSRVLHLGETDQRQQPDIDPANVELVPLRLELRGVRIGVMVVMQLFTAEPD